MLAHKRTHAGTPRNCRTLLFLTLESHFPALSQLMLVGLYACVLKDAREQFDTEWEAAARRHMSILGLERAGSRSSAALGSSARPSTTHRRQEPRPTARTRSVCGVTRTKKESKARGGGGR